MVDESVLAASRCDVTGQPCAGYLQDGAAGRLLGDPFDELMPPQAGARFGERLTNTVTLATGVGGDSDVPPLTRTLATGGRAHGSTPAGSALCAVTPPHTPVRGLRTITRGAVSVDGGVGSSRLRSST